MKHLIPSPLQFVRNFPPRAFCSATFVLHLRFFSESPPLAFVPLTLGQSPRCLCLRARAENRGTRLFFFLWMTILQARILPCVPQPHLSTSIKLLNPSHFQKDDREGFFCVSTCFLFRYVSSPRIVFMFLFVLHPLFFSPPDKWLCKKGGPLLTPGFFFSADFAFPPIPFFFTSCLFSPCIPAMGSEKKQKASCFAFGLHFLRSFLLFVPSYVCQVHIYPFPPPLFVVFFETCPGLPPPFPLTDARRILLR